MPTPTPFVVVALTLTTVFCLLLDAYPTPFVVVAPYFHDGVCFYYLMPILTPFVVVAPYFHDGVCLYYFMPAPTPFVVVSPYLHDGVCLYYFMPTPTPFVVGALTFTTVFVFITSCLPHPLRCGGPYFNDGVLFIT